MNQEKMLFEDWADAARDVIRAAGGTKVVAAILFPSKPTFTAVSRLNDALNPALDAKLSPDEFLLLAKIGHQHRCHALMRYMCEEIGYEPPLTLNAEDEKARLQRRFVEASAELHALITRMEKLKG